MTLHDLAALLLGAMGLAAGLLGGVAQRQLRAGVPMTLELWTAAGLVRLSGSTEWSAIATAAAVLAVRKLVTLGMRSLSAPGTRREGPGERP